MTKKERAQIVELLRCGADIVARGWPDSGGALSNAATELECPYFQYAYKAERAAWHDMGRADYPSGSARIESLLEAAARVEEGSYP